jgi:hypothetical protein
LEHVGGRRSIVGGNEFDLKKILNKKYTVTLGGLRSMNLHTTTNQKQAPIMGVRIGGVTIGGAQGGVSPSFWGP